MTKRDTSSAGFFEDKYREKSDFWNFSGSSYELSRYRAIIAALRHQRYRRAFEPGCSVGVLTEQLAGLCDAVEAIDFSPMAVAEARERCAHQSEVNVQCQSITDHLQVEGYDLTILSEIGYYFSPEDWTLMSAKLIASMPPGATLLAAHWLGVSADHRMHGDQVHAILRSQHRLLLEHEERHQDFRLDRWRCR